MRLKLFGLCLLVSWAAAENGWNPGTEYQYQLRGRTLTALHHVSKQYSGVLIRATVTVQPNSQHALSLKVSHAEYSPVHTRIPQDWTAKLPEGQLNYMSLPISMEPFELQLRGGVIESMYVSQDIATWEVNILKSIASLFQVDTQKVNLVRNQDAQSRYVTMEDRVNGQCETLYEISRVPERLLTLRPELVPVPSLIGSDEVLDIMKTTNYTNCKKRVGYHFGLTDITDWEKPDGNKLGKFMSRSSMSRVIVTGTPSSYTIQSSVSTDRLTLSPLMYNNQKGMIGSRLNLTLVSVRPANGSPQQVSQPRKISDLVYEYNPIFPDNQQPQGRGARRPYDRQFEGDEFRVEQETHHLGRSLNQSQYQDGRRQDDSSSSSSSSEEHQPRPGLSRPPMLPMLPFFMGYQGRSINYASQVDLVKAIIKISKEMASDLGYPSVIPQRDTLGKYTIISRLVRTMSTEQLVEVTNHLHAQATDQYLAWQIYRDAVATAGTGPALQLITQWIESGKVKEEEAAKLVAVLPNYVRTPTSDYIDLFFELATNSEVVRQQHLNSTAILSFCELVHKAQVNKRTAHNWFPVHSFGRFSPLNYRKISTNYIPYLDRQLKNALINSDSHKTQVYIHALGNLGHPKILTVLEPLLDKTSTFQRVLIVMSLSKLVQTYPDEAQSLLYDIYRNTEQTAQVRVAAVFQLIKTYPSLEILHKMAQFTNQDSSIQVNAAVKSAIENAAKLTDFINLRERKFVENTRRVVHLVSPKNYDLNLSRSFIRSFLIKELETSYTKQISYIGSSDAWLPNSLFYNVRKNLGGFKRQYLALGIMVSSVDDFLDQLFDHVTSKSDRTRGSTSRNTFSPRVISRLLNVRHNDDEELEGNILLQLAGGERFFAYNGHDVDLQRSLRMAALALRSKQSFNYMKLYNQYQVTIAFPTIMGVPFLYSLKTPTLTSLRGQVNARTSHPDLASNSSDSSIPTKIETTSDLHIVYSSKSAGKISFTTPWDHQRYMAGLNNYVQLNLPLKLTLGINTEKQKLQLYVKPLYADQDVNVLHYSTLPYTSKHDILNLVPASQDTSTQPISDQEPRMMDIPFGGESCGLSFRLKCSTEHDIASMNYLNDKLSQNDLMSIIYFPWLERSIKPLNVSLIFEGSKSETRSVTFMLDYDNTDTQFSADENDQSEYPGRRPDSNYQGNRANPTENSPMSAHRKAEFLDRVRSGMNNSSASIIDMAIKLNGPKNVYMVATAAYAQSARQDKDKLLFYLHRSSLPNQSKQLELCLSTTSEYLTVPWMSFTGALQNDPTSHITANIKYGVDCSSGQEINFNSKGVQTREYKESLRDHPVVQECQQRLNQNNYLHPACQDAMAVSNLPDLHSTTFNLRRVSESFRNVFNLLPLFVYQYVDDKMLDVSHLRQSLSIDFKNMVSVNPLRFSDSDNFSPNERTFNVRRNQNQFSPQHLRQSNGLFRQNNQPSCSLGANSVKTCDEKTYSINVGKCWHVALLSTPNRGRNFADITVLVRDIDSRRKEIKLVLGEELEVHLKPSSTYQTEGSPSLAHVYINGDEVEVSAHETTEARDGQGRPLIQVYALANGQVKVTAPQHDIQLTYDGQAALIHPGNGYRDDIRGLCGTHDGDQSTDFTTPRNCVLSDPVDFAATWAVLDETCQGPAKELSARVLDRSCVGTNSHTTTRNFNRDNNDKSASSTKTTSESCSSSSEDTSLTHRPKTCNAQQLRVVKSGNLTCFSQRPMHTCGANCRPNKTTDKKVAMVCLPSGDTSNHWIDMMRKGNHPNLSNRKPTKFLTIRVPDKCLPLPH